MLLHIYKDYNTLASMAANEIIGVIKSKPNAVLCLATGETPLLTYEMIAIQAIDENVDFSRCTFIGLDEWVNIPPDNEGSCHFFLEKNIFKPLHILNSQIHLFDALEKNLEAECRKMDKTIRENGGIDLMLVGVGMNGHIGFNEPGVPDNLYSHVIALDTITQSVGQKYFRQSTKLQSGITLGLQHFMECRKVIMMASGIKKSLVMRKTLEDKVSTEMPASMIRKHDNGVVMLDEEAAALLKKD